MNIYKYVAALEYYPNCRTCDSGYYTKLMFFANLKEILTYSLNNISNVAIQTIYTTSGKEVCDLRYDCYRHNCQGISLKIRGKNFRTVDDGRGTLVWKRKLD